MKPLRLYIENFMCHERSFIDFTQFNAALIVGKVENNELYSNGVGKTTIFKALEYVLFNQADVNLEKLIRDDTQSCKITLDFIVDDVEYRVSRLRTKKGSTDLSLFQRTNNTGSEEEVYHLVIDATDNDINYRDMVSPVTEERYWKDISGRRSADTEKDLSKLIKYNFKSFRNIIHFQQNAFDGLPTATPEKRKGILKDVLDLIIYSKLEKIAKDKSNILLKNIDRHKVLVENLGNPEADLITLNSQLDILNEEIRKKNESLDELLLTVEIDTTALNDAVTTHLSLESKFSALLTKEQTLTAEKSRIETSIKEYHSKKSNVIKAAKDLVEELKELKESQTKLIATDFSQIDILGEKLAAYKENVTKCQTNIENNQKELKKLSVPVPDKGVCQDCRQPITEKHKKECEERLAREMKEMQDSIKTWQKQIAKDNNEILSYQQTINSLNLAKQQLESLNTKISTKNKEITDKRTYHDEYHALLEKFNTELIAKTEELDSAKEDLKNSSMTEASALKAQIDKMRRTIFSLNEKVNKLRTEAADLGNSKAVLLHSIDQKKQDKIKLETHKKELIDLDAKFAMYPSVIQAFSSSGIPNLIIQNVLDDLQVEANSLLAQLKPGLQLSFFVEKTKGDGTEADTLDINYHINGKERYYEQLSGAMKLAVSFSLKLGLSFLLQKMIGTDIKFLLLDEIDQSLDKASVDAFADIVKFFQKDFTILIITHNDRLKDKFPHAILVEQDINMVSRARVVSSW